jgi:predicted HAD superfamily hydrolase
VSIEKNFHDNWKQDPYLKDLAEVISEIELLSLDIFDTVLFRLCAHPSEVFLNVGKVGLKKGFINSDFTPKVFKELRVLAEKKARVAKQKEFGTSEVTLEDIYQMIPERIGDPLSILSLELEIEKKECYVNPNVLSLIKFCKEKGIRIALVSDMYLSSEQIQDLLVSNDFPFQLVDKLLVSNEFGTDKASGQLFDILCKEFPQIKKNKMIHVGDSKRADVDGALNFGIKSIYYGIIPTKIDSIFEWEKVRFGSILPQLSSLRKLAMHNNYDGNEKFWFNIGASILGPFLTLFSEWVVETCQRVGKDTILPFMREGQLLANMIKSVASRTESDFKVEPIYISRQASYLASLESFNEEELGRLFERNNIKVKDLFKILCMDSYIETFKGFEDVYLTDSNQVFIEDNRSLKTEIFSFFANKYIIDELNSIIRDKRNLFLRYLQSKTNQQNDFVTVDLGFKGTIQQFIENAYRNSGVDSNITHLLAFGSEHTKHLLMSGIDIRGWLGNAGENDQLIKKIMRSPEIIEELILADCGSTLGYEREESGRVVPLLDDFDLSEDERKWKKLCQKGIMHFQQLWSNLTDQKPFLRKELMQQKEDWIYLLLRLIEMPTPEEAKKLGMLHHDDNFGSSHYSTICRPQDELLARKLGPEEFLKRSLYGYHVTGVYWPQGVLTINQPSFLFQKYLNDSNDNSYLAIMSKLVYEIKKKGFSSIIMYGAGEVGQAFIEVASLDGISVELVVDKKESLWGEEIKGVSIVSLEEAVEAGPHIYAIASLSFAKEIKADIEARYLNKQVKAVIFTPL